MKAPTRSFTNFPTGFARVTASRYAATSFSSCGTLTKSVRPRMPMPFRPPISHDAGLVAAIQMGGCGCWSGRGTMLRGGTVTKRP